MNKLRELKKKWKKDPETALDMFELWGKEQEKNLDKLWAIKKKEEKEKYQKLKKKYGESK